VKLNKEVEEDILEVKRKSYERTSISSTRFRFKK